MGSRVPCCAQGHQGSQEAPVGDLNTALPHRETQEGWPGKILSVSTGSASKDLR